MVNYEKYDIMNLEQLNKAKEELFKEIQTEKTWMFASRGKEELQHVINVEVLRAELRYVIKRIENYK